MRSHRDMNLRVCFGILTLIFGLLFGINAFSQESSKQKGLDYEICIIKLRNLSADDLNRDKLNSSNITQLADMVADDSIASCKNEADDVMDSLIRDGLSREEAGKMVYKVGRMSAFEVKTHIFNLKNKEDEAKSTK